MKISSMRVPGIFRIAVAVTLLIAVMTDTCVADGPPAAPIRAVTDTYFGTAVVGNYRYMENLKDPEVQAWLKAQAGYTRGVLDRIPSRAALAAREEGFHGLYSMSAYAHVHDGTPYPAVMCTTGANDRRVSSWHMMKMAARVQAASSGGRPVLLPIDYDAGHGIGSSVSQQAGELADEWSFALRQMGEHDFQTTEPRVAP